MTINEWAKDFKSYVNELQMPRDDYNGIMEYIDDALALLKEQEAVVPVYTTNSHPFHIGILYRCGNCHHSLIRDEDLFCRHCGKPIDWTKKAVKWDA